MSDRDSLLSARGQNWKSISCDVRYDNPWITVSHRDVIAPTGNPGIYGHVHFKNRAIGIVPIDDDAHTWLVGQARYTLQSYAWEIPEGGAASGESALAAAQRELREETGLQAKRWTSLLKLHTSNSVTDELAYSFIAQDLKTGSTKPDDTEQLMLHRVPLDDAINMAMDGTISDALAMTSLIKIGRLLDCGALTI